MSTLVDRMFGGVRLAAVLLVMSLLAGGCEAPPSAPPDSILGTWVSHAPRYRDRTFEIREDSIVFGTGKYSGSRLHILIDVKEQPGVQGWRVYTVHYREYDGSIGALDVHHRTQPNSMLRFANRREIWTRNQTENQDDA